MHILQKGFTIVELLVVIVVIAVLAAITIVSYNGIQARATGSAITSFINKASKQLAVSYINNSRYPDTLAATPEGPITVPENMTVAYVPNNTTNPPTYTLSVTSKGIAYIAGESSSPSQLVTSQFTEEFYSNQTLSGTPAVTNQVSTVNYEWGAGGPAGVGIDNFSAKWTANIQVPATGTYTFYVTSDDGQRLYVNNSLVIDNWVAQGPTTRQYVTSFTEGQIVAVRYEYYEIGGGAVARLEWTPPSGVRAPVPAV